MIRPTRTTRPPSARGETSVDRKRGPRRGLSVALGGALLFFIAVVWWAVARDPESAYPTYDAGLSVEADDAQVYSGDVVAVVEDAADAEYDASKAEASNEEIDLLRDDIFVPGDLEAMNEAPIISVLPESSKIKYRLVVLEHERFYRTHPSRLYVPRIRKDVDLKRFEFNARFAAKSQPVIVPYEAMRKHLKFTGKSFDSLEELRKIYPNSDSKFTYAYGSQKGTSEIDLGPAVANLIKGDGLRKTKKGRNFPRNMKVASERLNNLGLDSPKCLLLTDDTQLMLPSVWFGTPSDATKFHADCCDNYAFMILGTKKWVISPPSEARILKPKCAGGLCWVSSLQHPDEHASTTAQKSLRDRLQKVEFTLNAGEMLFLPTGWFHHVENEGPTVMVNYWARGLPSFVRITRDHEIPSA